MALNTQSFIQSLIREGYTHLCVVPCSFAKYVINAAINSPHITYMPCASEAIACSSAAGLKIAGKKPIVIVQSSGMTNMGSCITSLLKPYHVYFPILTSWRTYKEGDSEVQHAHLATCLPELINAYGYEHSLLDKQDEVKAIEQINQADVSPSIIIMSSGSFSEVQLEEKHKNDLSEYLPRSQFLTLLNKGYSHEHTVMVGTTGNTAREMYQFMPNTNNLYMAGNMGGALSLGLGIALAGKPVVVCGGDAEFVMHMGGMTTAGRYAENMQLIYILFDNEANKSTGGQNTYQSHVNYSGIAESSGFQCIENTIKTTAEFELCMKEVKDKTGLYFMHIKCSYDAETPRPPVEVVTALPL